MWVDIREKSESQIITDDTDFADFNETQARNNGAGDSNTQAVKFADAMTYPQGIIKNAANQNTCYRCGWFTTRLNP